MHETVFHDTQDEGYNGNCVEKKRGMEEGEEEEGTKTTTNQLMCTFAKDLNGSFYIPEGML